MTNQEIQQITVGLLTTATIIALSVPQRAQAAGFSYAYAYQQITNLKAQVDNPLTVTFGSDNVSNATVLEDQTTTPLNLSGVFDSPESFVNPPTSGANLGLGNNFGFFSNPQPPQAPNYSSSKGPNSPNYARGDSQLLGITDTNQIGTALFDLDGEGLNFASVAESYLETPTELPETGFRVYQGNGIGRSVLASETFSVTVDTTIDFAFDYRNEGYAELTETTPPGAPLGNQATGKIAFVIAINTVEVVNGTEVITSVYTCSSFVANNDFGVTDPGISNPDINSGSVLFDDSGDGCIPFTFLTGTDYRLEFRNEQIVDTRLVQSQLIPEPSTTNALLTLGSLGLFPLTRKIRRLRAKPE